MLIALANSSNCTAGDECKRQIKKLDAEGYLQLTNKNDVYARFSINIEPVNDTIRANVGHLAISDPLGISERIDVLPVVAGSDNVPD